MLAAVRLHGEFTPLGDQAAHFPYLHPGKAALVSVPGAGGAGVLGQLRPDVAAAFGLDDLAVYIATLNDRFATAALRTAAFADLGTYPPASQDLAVVVGRGVPPPTSWAGAPRRRQARAQRARLRRVRGRPGAGRQALPGPARRHGLAGAHADARRTSPACAPRSSRRSSGSSRPRCGDRSSTTPPAPVVRQQRHPLGRGRRLSADRQPRLSGASDPPPILAAWKPREQSDWSATWSCASPSLPPRRSAPGWATALAARRRRRVTGGTAAGAPPGARETLYRRAHRTRSRGGRAGRRGDRGRRRAADRADHSPLHVGARRRDRPARRPGRVQVPRRGVRRRGDRRGAAHRPRRHGQRGHRAPGHPRHGSDPDRAARHRPGAGAVRVDGRRRRWRAACSASVATLIVE